MFKKSFVVVALLSAFCTEYGQAASTTDAALATMLQQLQSAKSALSTVSPGNSSSTGSTSNSTTTQSDSDASKGNSSTQKNNASVVNAAKPAEQASEENPAKAPQLYMAKYDGKYRLFQGTIIPGALTTSINSDLGGAVTAIVTGDVYDSVEGTNLLIPKGSKLIADIGNVKVGQERMGVIFNRVMFPNGNYVMLSGMQGSDEMGRTGLDAEVNNHIVKMLTAGLAMAYITYRVDKSTTSDTTVSTSSSSTSLETSAGKELETITNKVLDRYTSLNPTLLVEAGTRVKILLTKDITMEPYVEQ